MPPAWSMSACVASVACSASTPRFQRNGATARSPASRRHGPPAPASTTIARPSGVSTTIRVALTHVQHRHAQPAVAAPQDRKRRQRHRHQERERGPGGEGPAGATPRAPVPRRESTGQGGDVRDDRAGAGRGQADHGAGHRGGERRNRAQDEEHRPDGAEDGRRPRRRRRRRRRRPGGRGRWPPPASGTAARLATRPMVESWLKCTSATGSTASCAARLTASEAASVPRGNRCHHDACRCRERELESGIEQITRAHGQDRQRGEGQAVGDRRLAVEQDGGEHEHGHDRRADHRRFGPDDGGEAEHGHDAAGGGGPPAAAGRAHERPHGAPPAAPR